MEMGINSRKSIVRWIVQYNALIMLIVLVLISSTLTKSFFTAQNIFNLLRQTIPLLLVSMGMLLVVLTGNIDLSVGSVAGVCSMILANSLINWNMHSVGGLLLAIVISLAAGFLIGCVTACLVAYGNMASFVATLAMMTMMRGFAYLITNGQPIRMPETNPSTQLLNVFGSETIGPTPIPWPVLLGVIVVLVFLFIEKRTPFGRLLVATGSNEDAVRLAGIEVKRYKLAAYALCGALSAMAGIVATSRASIGTPVTGLNYELDAIAACVIGGASLSGGKGTVLNTVVGTLVLGLIGNTMNLLSLPPYPQQIIKGAIIIGAVFIQQSTGGLGGKK